jgi:aerobic-type carbon monoxide dehydrogenase small subunit (CoxS/CutS family)
MAIKFTVNQRVREVEAAPDTPLLYVLINELELHGPRFGCGLAQCGSCSVLMDGVEIRSCITPVGKVGGKSITTFEGLPAWYAEQRKLTAVPELHPLQQAVIDEQATQCGYCLNGLVMKAAEVPGFAE